MEKTAIKCPDCEATFTLKKNMYAHCRNIHKIEHLSKKPKMSQCHICDVKFANKKCLSQHMKTFHNNSTNEKHTRITCPYDLCEENLFTSLKLREHLCVKHNITVELEEITFDNLKEFETWKQKIEKETVSMYVLDTGAKKLFNGILKQYYFCHRSLNYRKSGNDLRLMKSMGSNKIGKTCPSKLETTIVETNGVASVNVKYWKTHCGHAQEIGRLKIDKENRAMIA
ncbi:zinc finger and BTB domain-containing protein 6-like, partial [Aphis craccivora]